MFKTVFLVSPLKAGKNPEGHWISTTNEALDQNWSRIELVLGFVDILVFSNLLFLGESLYTKRSPSTYFLVIGLFTENLARI